MEKIKQVSVMEMNFPKDEKGKEVNKVDHILKNIIDQDAEIKTLKCPNLTEELKTGFYATSNKNIFINVRK